MRLWKRIAVLLSIIGPGIITANMDNDAGGIAIYSIAGAHFGYSLLWTLMLTAVVLVVVQEMVARMGIVTGKGLADLIRENYGVKITFWLMAGLFITDLGNTTAEFAGWAASMEIFGISKYVSVPAGAVFIWLLVIKGTYRVIERIFLVVCLIYFSYIISAIMAKPDWTDVLTQTVKPSFRLDSSYLLMMIGLVGTTITPWMQFYLQSAIVEKGVRKEEYWASRLDVIAGSFMMHVVAFFIIVACGATLFNAGIKIERAEEAAMALSPFAGKYASIFFAVGLANASLFAASILPLTTAYYICQAMGWETGLNKTFKEAPQFMGLYSALIIIGSLIILLPGAPLMPIMWMSQVLNGMVLPFVLIFMLSLVNKKELMGEYTNSRLLNWIAWSATVIMIALTVILVVSAFVRK